MNTLYEIAHDLSPLQPVLTLLQVAIGGANVLLKLARRRRARNEKSQVRRLRTM
ncbi:hypothetical protein ACIRL3_15795 [Streptomyces sp. NPDC102384]|uniref:hypothetical protein n=1 Tax=unclassified Streptomyces TaxID=2593676 RepID=UPI00382BACBB